MRCSVQIQEKEHSKNERPFPTRRTRRRPCATHLVPLERQVSSETNKNGDESENEESESENGSENRSENKSEKENYISSRLLIFN